MKKRRFHNVKRENHSHESPYCITTNRIIKLLETQLTMNSKIATSAAIRRAFSSVSMSTSTSSSSSSLVGRTIAICGGGVMGLASAVHLARLGLGRKVIIIERDTSYKYNSAMLSAGGIRQQFSLPENILMSNYSSDFITEYVKREAYDKQQQVGIHNTNSSQELVDEVAFKPHGYLFLGSSDESRQLLQKNNETQRLCGVDWIHLADAKQLSNIYPWLNTEDITLGSYSHKDHGGTKEGYFDPWGLMQCMKREALLHDVKFVEGQIEKVHCISHHDGSPPGVGDPLLTIDAIHLRHGKSTTNNNTNTNDEVVEEIHGLEALINTTGPWSNQFVKETICEQNESLLSKAQQKTILDMIPIERRKRCIFYIHCPDKHQFSHPMPSTTTPLTVDPKGVYFRSEGSTPGHFICGVSPEKHQDHVCIDDDDLQNVDHHLFEEIIWPALAHRVPAFNELKVLSSWSGFYDYNPVDQNAIIGFHPNFTNMIFAGGFSGHGLQMAPAAGNAVAELFLYGGFRKIDLKAFSFDRLEVNEPYRESAIV